MNLSRIKFAAILIITIFLSSFFTIYIGNNINFSADIPEQSVPSFENSKKPDDFNKLEEIYSKIQALYINDINSEKLIDGAIQGMVDSLGDRHSTYMDATEAKQFYTPLDDTFEGIGAEVTMENGKVTIISPIKGSPSDKAGILPKDQIIKVNGESLEGLNLYEAVNKIRGPKGTEAILEVVRPNINEALTISVIRDEIPNITVYSETITVEEGLIGKIELTNFGVNTFKEFNTALKDLEKQNIKGLILDMRGNPGGYLQSVLDIGDLVIPNNGVIVQIEDKLQNNIYRSDMGEAKYPIVTLINGGSASASEILASALQEAGGYPLVGETTYGKGTVQNVYQLKDGSNIKLTIAKWLTSKGNWINEKGVEPDIEVLKPPYYEAMSFSEDINLKYDDNNVNVMNLQVILEGLGYEPQRKDGYFDKNTEIALSSFQKAQKIEVTGTVNSDTAEMLQKEIIEKIKDPANDTQLQTAIETLKKMME